MQTELKDAEVDAWQVKNYHLKIVVYNLASSLLQGQINYKAWYSFQMVLRESSQVQDCYMSFSVMLDWSSISVQASCPMSYPW